MNIRDRYEAEERGDAFDENRRHRYVVWERFKPQPEHTGDLFGHAPPMRPGRRAAPFSAAPVGFIMLNPSVADGVDDDPTSAKVGAFARVWGAGGWVIGNIHTLVSTDPNGLISVMEPNGPEADRYLFELAQLCSAWPLVVGWGATIDRFMQRTRIGGRPIMEYAAIRTYRARVAAVMQAAHVAGVEVVCLGMTASGAPRHPLYLPIGSQLRPWRP